MNIEDVVKQQNIPRTVGHKLVGVSENVLSESLGREAFPKELADLAETMVGELLSSAYILMREKGGGPQEAESWLKRTLAMGAAGVRMRGSEALIKIEISIRDMPNKIGRRMADPAEEIQKDLAPAAPCTCQKDSEGHCQRCASVLANVYREFFAVFQKMARFKDAFSDLCKPCEHEQLDYAMSTIVATLFDLAEHVDEEKKAVFAQETLALLYQMASMMGVQEMPLTVKAWKDSVETKGIKVEGLGPA